MQESNNLNKVEESYLITLKEKIKQEKEKVINYEGETKIKEDIQLLCKKHNIENIYPFPIISMLKEENILVVKQDLDNFSKITSRTSRIGGIIIKNEDIKSVYGNDLVIILNESDLLFQRRFIAAHEYAHYKYDYNILSNVFYKEYLYNENKNEESEKRANCFARNILMPENIFKDKFKEFYNINIMSCISKLAEYFGVVEDSIYLRIAELNLL